MQVGITSLGLALLKHMSPMVLHDTTWSEKSIRIGPTKHTHLKRLANGLVYADDILAYIPYDPGFEEFMKQGNWIKQYKIIGSLTLEIYS